MKKIFTSILLLAATMSVFAQEAKQDAIDYSKLGTKVSYVPNKFKDNWELGLNVGLDWQMNGLASGNVKVDPAFGFDIFTAKWFNPYFGARLGLTGMYPHKDWMHLKDGVNPAGAEYKDLKDAFQYYVHTDLLWNVSNQFAGYNPDRVYNAILYLHAGVIGFPEQKIQFAYGAGFLNRFKVAEHWTLNLDLRGTLYRDHQEAGVIPDLALGGLGGNLSLFFGFSYRFKEAEWKTYVEPSDDLKAYITDLQGRAKDAEVLAASEKANADQLRAENNDLRRKLEAAKAIKLDLRNAALFFDISKSNLDIREVAHYHTYLNVVKSTGLSFEDVDVEVVGTADKGTGSKFYNEKLAERRAQAVKKMLVEEGFKAERITTRIELRNGSKARLDRCAEIHFKN